MAKFVVSGKVDCAAYVRAEMLADRLKACLPDFHVHKIAVPGAEWGEWVREECERRGWEGHSGDVLVWRELVKRGGRGLYLGGVTELEEYALHYHNITPHTATATEERIAVENDQTLQIDRTEMETRAKPRPLHIAITSAASPLAYHLIHQIIVGGVFGDQAITLRLLDTSTYSNELAGIAMEITDMASPTVERITCTSSSQEAFRSASVVFVLDYPENVDSGRDEVEENKCSDLASAAALFHKYGAMLDFCALKDVRVIVAGRYSNMAAAVIASSASSLPPSHIIASSCLAVQRAKSAIAGKLGLNTADIEQVCVWGRCAGGENDALVDVNAVRVRHYPGAVVGPDPFSLPLSRCLADPSWLASGLAEEMKRRRRVREESGGVLSEAVAIANVVCQWLSTEAENSSCSVGVVSDGNCYGFPVGVACSVPVRSEGVEWHVVRDLELTPAIQEQLALQRESLSKEMELACQVSRI